MPVNRISNENIFNLNSDSENEVSSQPGSPQIGQNRLLDSSHNTDYFNPRVEASSSMNEPTNTDELDNIDEIDLGVLGTFTLRGSDDDHPLIQANYLEMDNGDMVDPASIKGFRNDYKYPEKDYVDHVPWRSFHPSNYYNGDDPKGKGSPNVVRSYELSGLRNNNLIDKPYLYRNADYTRKNLHHIDFTGLNLKGLDFYYADFRNAKIDHADFTGARLVGANFDGMKPVGTNFTSANMQGARLCFWYGAKDVKFIKTDLRESLIHHSTFFKCTFSDVLMKRAQVKDLIASDNPGVIFNSPVRFEAKVKKALKTG